MSHDPPADRRAFYGEQVSVMTCVGGNVEHGSGKPIVILTIACRRGIEPLVLSMQDSRQLVASLLVSLATNDDEFAKRMLYLNFAADDDGQFHYPVPESW